MAKTEEMNNELKRLLDGLVDGIDVSESTEWESETRTVSKNIREALAEQMGKLGSLSEVKFLDYCNCVKSLLAVHNYGNLDSVEQKDVDRDKKLMKDGVNTVIKHVEEIGFDITPYLNKDDCMQIFGDNDEKRIETPVTFSAATVMTTLVYFRRACKRKGLYSDEELGSLTDRIAKTVANILYGFAKFVLANGYEGWGFTLDSNQSVAVTLNDTYAVVDAISRFDDAFNQKDKIKRDQEFLDKVVSEGEALGFEGNLVDCCVNAIYRVAYNTYMRDKNKDRVYGRSIFFTETTKQNNKAVYSYNPITIEQIASSNRSSALFNPLYVAMITMYGYNEKEIVIRRFMDDYKLANQYYEAYEKEVDASTDNNTKKGVGLIYKYAEKELDWYDVKNFKSDVDWITRKHEPASNDYSDNEVWKRRYDIARVFQKFVETQVSDDLMKIEEYRDYLNATKDAIDQVQVAYRKLDDSQRLGIVDTDYVMFSALDIDVDSVTISKLNKAGISVNYLRPMLLSSKIMIVNALIKYPQADMESIYNAIKESKHRKVVVKKRAVKSDYEWLWNEDAVDMNATARHCEAIMYDYFDYYEKYELSYKALNNLKKYYGDLITAESVSDKGELIVEKLLEDKGMNDFKRVVLNLTRKNVDEVRAIYTVKLQDKNDEIERLTAEIEKLKKKHTQDIADERAKHQNELAEKQVSYDIGNTVRGWIRDEADRHLREMLSYMIINNINGYQFQDDEDFNLSDMMRGRNVDEIADGQFDGARELSKKIMEVYKRDEAEASKQFDDKFIAARKMQIVMEGALDDMLKSAPVKNVARNEAQNLDVRNQEIHDAYGKIKDDRIDSFDVCNEKGRKDEDNDK